MAGIKKFEDLECWKKSRLLAAEVFTITSSGLLDKDYSLKDQILRSSGSVMDNIAEGFERGGNKEFIQFLFYSKASCAEVKSQLYRALDRDYIGKSEFNRLYTLSNEVSKLINGLINYLKRSEKSGFKFKN